MSWFDIANATLQDEHVQVRPVAEADREALRPLAKDPDIWRYFVTLVRDDADFDAFFDATLADLAAGARVPFVIVDRTLDAAAGSMSMFNFAERDGRLEIGWSWLGRDFQGRGVNHWAKSLLLEHAFERLGAERVEFKTDQLNEKARRALSNIGAVEEGTLRSYNPMPGGRRRDAVYYSVLRGEWPAVRERLLTGEKIGTAKTP
jgi:RimJ/RimL family protein N-acetyltransferase